jgi:hypothetical protein
MDTLQEVRLLWGEIGATFVAWSAVERSLLEVLNFCFSEREFDLIVPGYYAVQGFDQQVAFVHEIVVRKLDNDEVRRRWITIKNRARKAAESRNKLAHWQSMAFPHEVPGRHAALVSWREKLEVDNIGETVSNPRKPPKGSLFLLDVIGIKHEFWAVDAALRNFRWRMQRVQSRVGTPDTEQAKPLPSLEEVEGLIRGLFGQPTP